MKLNCILFGIFAVVLSSCTFAATYGGGSGTSADPYLIYTAEQMNTIGANSGDWASCFKLMADIDMSAYTGTQYNIIGNSTTKFTGTFDGNGHIISNLTYTTTAAVNYVGVFGDTSNATIENLGVENVNLYTGGFYVGGLVGYQYSGTITNCHSTGTVTTSSSSSSYPSFAGGLAGYQYYGTTTNCYSTGAVSSSSSSYPSYAGGLVGYQYFSTTTNCYCTGSVSSLSSSYFSYAGGLAGYLYSGTTTNCYSTKSVYSSSTSYYSYAGGLVGQSSASIGRSYSTGPVFASGTTIYKGGLAGFSNATFTACFWDTQSSGMTTGVGTGTSTGATGKTTAEMRTLSTFTDASWDFTTIWAMPESDCPYLAWQGCATYPAGDTNQDCSVDMDDLAILSAHWLE